MGFCKIFTSIFLFSITMLIVVASEENPEIKQDKISLLSLKSGIVSDPQDSLTDWSSSGAHVCTWFGVKCNNESTRVTQLDLSGCLLRGKISPAISNLSSLTVLDLSRNFFQGFIPPEIGSLYNLRQLSLSENLLEGNIPVKLGSLDQLVYLDLGSNGLTGQIPFQLLCNGSSPSSSSSPLEYIDLSNNSLTGEIPLKNECLLKELRFLLLWSNKLIGKVPTALSNSSKLKWIDLESNSLTGELPSGIVSKMPDLKFLLLSYNHFFSPNNNTNLEPFFASLANSSNLQELELAGNSLGGEIPSVISKLSNLVQIHLDQNRIHGSIPPKISNLVNLSLLNLSSNLLNGSVPPELCKMNRLERVYLSNNLLTGGIPPALGNTPHLGLLDLSRNKLSGSIPDSFASLPQLRRLLLYGNQLSGAIPRSLGKCINLEILDLSHNKLSGIIPGEIVSKLRNLKLYLNLSSNHFTGPLPLELSKMDMLLAIDLSSNNLSGTIPPQLGSCIALEHLNLSGNSLEGNLPSSIGQLPYLKALDVSLNRLQGEIPESLQASSTLKQLNLSFNLFFGNVSNKGAFSNLTMKSFLGNSGLCGSIKTMPACKKKHTYHFVILPILLSLFAVPLLCVFGYPLVHRSRFLRQLAIFNDGDYLEDKENDDKKDPNYPRISYQQLIEATGGFSASSLIGSGRFGQVYKGVLHDNMRIAVKVIDPKTAGEVLGSFRRECQILKRTRHRNLIRIITICSKPDFKALVLPLMPNGSLERHLYPSNEGLSCKLNVIQLVNICSDVAEGVAYLHHHSPVKVVHCDLKPSNILLDDDLTALVTDFGIARLVKGIAETVSTDDSVSFTSTDGLLCGSVGYIAPEYGMGRRASIHGDVYSFGVLLLEIVTRRRPTDVLINEGSSLHEFVKSHYPHKLEGIVKQALVRYRPQGMLVCYDKIWCDAIMELIELGLVCTQNSPSTRPNMLDVAHEMGRLKQYLSTSPSLISMEEEANSSKPVVFDP